MNTNISNRQHTGILSVISLLTLGMLLTACSLDEHPRDQIPEEEAYTTPTALFQNTVATLYAYIGSSEDGQGLQGTCRGVYDLQTFGSDEAILPTRGGDWYDGGLWQDMYRHSWSAGHDLPKNAWLYLYKVITLCNRSLEQIDAHKRLLSDAEYMGCQAEVRALRAIYYWYLIDLFGDVPLVTTTKVSMQEVKQSGRAEVFRFAVEELEAAKEYLSEEPSQKQGDYYGRVTTPVVTFVLAKLMLNAEVYSGTPQWQKTIDYCDELQDYGYKLEQMYSDNFAVRNDYSVENIWTIPMDKDLYTTQQQNMYRSYHYRHAAAYGFTGENGSCATRKVLEVFSYGTEEEDVRFNMNYWATEVYDLLGNEIQDRTGNLLVYHPWEVAMDLSGSPYVETAGARMRKYEVDRNATKDGKLMDNDIVLFRFADVLLMRAEAKFRLGGASYAAGSYATTAQQDFDAVRDRVGELQRTLTLQSLLDERLLELCWEGWRRQDLIRFDQYESLFEGDAYYDKVDERDGHTKLYPIPADVMALNHNLKQNPGY
jgi:hypothetical protein